MAGRPGWSVAGVLWVVAFAALGLAAVAGSADARGVVSLAVVGHGLTAVGLHLDRADAGRPPWIRGRRFTLAVLAAFAAGEAVGVVVSLVLGATALALWFGLGLSFALAGVAATRRRVPSDPVLGGQLFFHATMVIPLLVAVPGLVLDVRGVDAGPGPSLGRASMGLAVMIFALVGLPLLFVSLATVLAYTLLRPSGPRDLAWPALLAHQSAFVLILVRWASNGL